MDNNFEDPRGDRFAEYGQVGRRYRPDRFGGQRHNWPARQGIGFAVVLIVFGVALFLDNMGVYAIRELWQFWPLFICVPGIQHLITSKTWSGRVWGGVMLIGGALWTAENIGILHWPMGAIWSLFLIGVGFMLLVQAVERQSLQAANPEAGMPGDAFMEATDNHEDFVKDVVIFSGHKRRIRSSNFHGGEIVAFFGGVEMDLRGAIPDQSQNMVIDAVAVFGGINIKIPDTWRVVMRGTGVFGGYEDKTIPPTPAAGVTVPTLILTGSAVFGGVSIE
jgi:predicted membrane protein